MPLNRPVDPVQLSATLYDRVQRPKKLRGKRGANLTSPQDSNAMDQLSGSIVRTYFVRFWFWYRLDRLFNSRLRYFPLFLLSFVVACIEMSGLGRRNPGKVSWVMGKVLARKPWPLSRTLAWPSSHTANQRFSHVRRNLVFFLHPKNHSIFAERDLPQLRGCIFEF
jgi:hypothetical protein